MQQFDRITRSASVMGGKACVRGIRVTVSNLLSQIAMGRTHAELLSDYPYLQPEDITQVLQYAAWLAEEREVALAVS